MRTSWIRALILVVVLVGGVITPVAPVGDARATPSGFVTIPDANVHEDLPVDRSLPISKEDLEGSVMVSDNASTTEIVVTNSERAEGYLDNGTSVGGGSLALVIQDDTNHAGREVAIPADAVKGAIGRIPEAVHGTHEDGSEWTSQVRAESGLLIFEVPHFSSNTVTFSGEVTVSGSYTDGSSVSYNVNSLDSVSNFTINVTGVTTSEIDNTTDRVSAGGSTSLSVAGNLEPRGPGQTEPRITVTADEIVDGGYNGTNQIAADASPQMLGPDAGGKSELYIGTANGTFPAKYLEIPIQQVYEMDSATADIYIVDGERPDGNVGEGTLVASGVTISSTGYKNITLPDNLDLSGAITVELDQTSATGVNANYASINTRAVSGSSIGFKNNNGDTFDGVTGGEIKSGDGGTITLSTNDGVSESIGNLDDDERVSVPMDLTTSTDFLTVSADTGAYRIESSVRERLETVDPSVTVNNQSTAYTGRLSNGSTVSLSANASWVESGTNYVNISVGDGSLSADAPQPSVSLDYRHEATDEISVNYSADGWTERYNTSRTFASTQEDPSFTVPFQGDVTEITRLKARTDGGSWSTVADSRYSLDGSELSVQLDDGDGDGDVDASTEMSVRVTARHVEAVNGGITVTDPILPGEDSDVELRIDSKNVGFYVDITKVPTPGVRYSYQESWSNPETHMIVTASGEKRLKFPNAPEGGSARVTMIPVTVTPESGDAKVSVADPDEPTITLDGGSSSGDDVTIRYLEASTGTTYNLYSTSRDRIVAKETADAGTVAFVEDDSAESLMINATSSGGGGGGLGFEGNTAADYGTERPVLVMGALAALVIGLVWATGRTGLRGRSRWALVGAVSLGLGLISLESLYPGAISRRIGEGIGTIFNQAGSVVPIAGIGAVVIVGYTVVSWWQSRKNKASTPDTKVTFSLGDRKK